MKLTEFMLNNKSKKGVLIMYTIKNDFIRVTVKDGGAFEAFDRRVGKYWKTLESDSFKTSNFAVTDDSIAFDLIDGDNCYRVTYTLTDKAEFKVAISGDMEIAMETLSYPMAVDLPRDHYIVETDSEGMLLPVTDTEYALGLRPLFFCGGGCSMAWIGAVDKNLSQGYTMTFETPFDAATNKAREDGAITVSPVWLSSMQKLSYERVIRYSFFDKGGYVAQCKAYREYIWDKNKVTTLKERVEQLPAIEKMLGAVHIYLWDTARTPEFLQKMKNDGVERAFVLWDPNHRPYPIKDFDKYAKELGYASGAYDLYTDFGRNTPPPEETPLATSAYPGEDAFEKLTAVQADGSRYKNGYGNFNCPVAIRPVMIERINKRMESYPNESLFLDVYCANGVYECYSKEHPLTREGYANAMMENCKMLQDKYGIYIGGEFGADYGVPTNSYFHGMMTLQVMWFNSEKDNKGTILYGGNWRCNENPSIQTGISTASETYHKYSINEYTRLPLYQLVYHDAAVTSWRWEDGNASCPEIWWKKDLYNMLYGTVPLWSIDASRYEAFENDFADSYKKICPWLYDIRYDEMVDHKFLSHDHTLQMSTFSSGRSIIVNFSGKDAAWEGKTIPAKGYVII